MALKVPETKHDSVKVPAPQLTFTPALEALLALPLARRAPEPHNLPGTLPLAKPSLPPLPAPVGSSW